MGYSLGNSCCRRTRSTPTATSTGPARIENPGVFGLSSYHPGGANVLLLDGSVRFLKDSASHADVWALGSISQGEIISADAYLTGDPPARTRPSPPTQIRRSTDRRLRGPIR